MTPEDGSASGDSSNETWRAIDGRDGGAARGRAEPARAGDMVRTQNGRSSTTKHSVAMFWQNFDTLVENQLLFFQKGHFEEIQ